MHSALRLAAASFLLLSFLLPAPARAQVDEAGAQALKVVLEEEILLMGSIYNGIMSFGEGMEAAEVIVTPQGDHYRVRYEDLRMLMAETGDLEFGSYEMSMTPLGGDQFRVSDLSDFGPILLRDEEGEIGLIIEVTDARADGVYSTEIASLIEGGLSAREVRIAPNDEVEGVLLENLSIVTSDFTHRDGIVSLRATVSAETLRLDADETAGGQGYLRVNGLETTTFVESFDYRGFRELVASGKAEDASPASYMAFYDGLMTSSYSVSGVEFRDEDSEMSLDALDLGFEITLTDDPTGRGGATLALQGLDIDSEELRASSDPRLIPRDLKLALRLEDVPTAPLTTFYNALYENADYADIVSMEHTDPEVVGEEARDAINEGFLKMQAGLMASDMRLIIDELMIFTEAATISAKGEALVDATAIYGATASATAGLLGAQALQAIAQEMAASGNPEAVETAQGLLAGLGMMMAFSQGPERPEPSSPEALSYLLQLLANGSVTVNGIPVIPPPGQDQ